MRNFRQKAVSAALALTLTIPAFCGCNIVTQGNSESESTISTTSAEPTPTPVPTLPPVEVIVKTEGGKTIVDSDYVRLMDDVKPEMMNPDYWLKEEDNKVLMNDEEIAEFNRKNRGQICL